MRGQGVHTVADHRAIDFADRAFAVPVCASFFVAEAGQPAGDPAPVLDGDSTATTQTLPDQTASFAAPVSEVTPGVVLANQPVGPAMPVLVTTPALSAQRKTAETLGVAADNPLPDTTFTWGGYFQAIGVLILLLIALWFGLRMIRRLGTGRFMSSTPSLPRHALRLEAQLPLGQHKGVFVVRFLNKRLVLGVTERQITLLTETETRDDETNSQNFQQIMHNAQSQDVDADPRQSVDSAGAPGPGLRG